MAQLLLTDWLTICTAGPTVDGRTIEEKWLTEAAKNYDREEYPAFVNCEHWFGNLGTVWELRTERDKKNRLCLQARIRVNKYFLQQNAEGVRLCYSAEFLHNFAETGETYLVGLATTDTPASLGTTETHFNRQEKDLFRADAVEFEKIELCRNEETGIYEAVKTAFKEFFTSKKQEINEMTKEEFADAMKPFQEQLSALSGKVEELAKKPETENKPEPENKPKPEDKPADKTAEALTTLSGQIKELSEQVTKLAAEIPPKTTAANAGTGEADSEPLI